MPVKVLMPALSPTMTEGTLAKWLKKEGDEVAAGDVIAEIETDKATMEVEAVDEGRIGKILVAEGTPNVPVNELIAILLEEGEDDGALSGFAEGAQDKSAQGASNGAANGAANGKEADAPKKDEPHAAAAQGDASSGKAAGKASGDQGRVFASPLAKRIAADKGIDLASLQGSGPRGRIVKADLENAPAGAAAAAKSASAPSAGSASATTAAAPAAPAVFGPNARELADKLGMAYTAVPNSGIRKTIARRLSESKQTVPHFYLTIECRLDNLLALRKQMNDEANGKYKLSVNDFIVKACANALKAYPAANVAWTDEAILQFVNADISVAVSTPNGLMTPIVKAAETKGLRTISEEVKDLATRARDGKLKPEEFQGGTFTVSNLGMFGIKEFGAIINPPQSCILAVGAGEEKPFVEKGEIKIGTFMTCTLSVDHRSVDGSVGAEYLQILKGYIENPISMLL